MRAAARLGGVGGGEPMQNSTGNKMRASPLSPDLRLEKYFDPKSISLCRTANLAVLLSHPAVRVNS